jgi:hypothetical protein
VNLVHQDLEAAIHNLVYFFGVQFLRHRGIIGHIREEHGHQLSFSLNRASGCEDLLGQNLGRVGLGLGIIDCRWG